MPTPENSTIPTEAEYLTALKACMNKIGREILRLPENIRAPLSDRTMILWQKVNGSQEEVQALEYNIMQATAYILVNQFLFYHLLETQSNFSITPLELLTKKADTPKSFQIKYFEPAMALTETFKPIFEIEILKLLPNTPPIVKALNFIIEKIAGMQFESLDTDVLGKIFHSMIPPEIRKPLAAYYTGNAPARLLAELVISDPKYRIADFACGSGTLLLEAYRVKKQLYLKQSPSLSTGEIHKQILERELVGNDITHFATHLTALNLSIQDLSIQVDKLQITAQDGLSIHLDYKLDGVLMNPPFSRRADMMADFSQHLEDLSRQWFPEDKTRARYMNRKMGLHGYFIYYADRMIRDGGFIAMVLPSATFTTDYTAFILRFLEDRKYAIKNVIEILTHGSAFSEDCTFKEYMVILEKGRLQPDQQTLMVSLKDKFTVAEAPGMAEAIRNQDTHPNVMYTTIPTDELYRSDKWAKLFSPNVGNLDWLFSTPQLAPLKTPKTSDKLKGRKRAEWTVHPSKVEVKIGYSGTYSEFLMLPNKTWNIELHPNRPDHFLISRVENPAESCPIAEKYLVRAIRKASFANGLKVSPTAYTLNLPYELPEELDEFRQKYLIWAEEELEKKITRERKNGHKRNDLIKLPVFKDENGNSSGQRKLKAYPWYSHAYRNKCTVSRSTLFIQKKYQVSARRSLAPLATEKVTVNHGSLYYVVSPDAPFYAAWMNSGIFFYILFRNHRIIHKDYWEMMIRDFYPVLYPVYDAFSTAVRKNIISAWEELATIQQSDLPFIPHQFGKKSKPLPERINLDMAWLVALGVPKKEQQPTLDALYGWLRIYFEMR